MFRSREAAVSDWKREKFKTDAEYREWLVAALRAQATFVPDSRVGDVMLEAAAYLAGEIPDV